MTLRPNPLDDNYRVEDSLRYQQLKEETGFREDAQKAVPTEPPTYRDSTLFQGMINDLGLVELSNGQVVPLGKKNLATTEVETSQPSRLVRRIGALTNMGCAECLREKLALQRPLPEIANLILRVRYGASIAEVYEPSREFIADASELENLVQAARGRSNPRYSVQRLAGA